MLFHNLHYEHMHTFYQQLTTEFGKAEEQQSTSLCVDACNAIIKN